MICINQEYASMPTSYLYTHEPDLGLGHMHIEVGKQLLTCSICAISYCEKCGKELSTCIPSSQFDSSITPYLSLEVFHSGWIII